MSIFDDIWAAQGEFDVDPDLMGGEVVTFIPLNGTARQINAIVRRSGLRDVEGVFFADITVTVRDDATYGISMAEYNKGGGKLLIAKRKGGTAETLYLTGEPIDQAAGMITFKVA